MGKLDEWKQAKLQFEKATSKKKPTNVFLGIRIPTGLESATKGYDTARGSGDVSAMKKAQATYLKTVDSYLKILEKASKKDKGVNYKSELQKLRSALIKIGSDIALEIKLAETEARRPQREALSQLSEKIENELKPLDTAQLNGHQTLVKLVKQSKAQLKAIVVGMEKAKQGNAAALKQATKAQLSIIENFEASRLVAKEAHRALARAEIKTKKLVGTKDYEALRDEDSEVKKLSDRVVLLFQAMKQRGVDMGKELKEMTKVHDASLKLLGGSTSSLQDSLEGRTARQGRKDS